MSPNSIATSWSPYIADDRDVIAAASDDLGERNDNAEPAEVTALREAAAHFAGLTCRRGTNSLDIHGPSPEVARWFLASGAHPFHYECNDRRVVSMDITICGVLVNVYIDERDAAWSVLPAAPAVAGPAEEDAS